MIYWFNEARNVEEYRAEKAAREKAEQDKKDKQYNSRYFGMNANRADDGSYKKTDGNTKTYYGNYAYTGSKNRETEDDYTDEESGKRYVTKTRDADDSRRVRRSRAVSARANGSYKGYGWKPDEADAVNRNMRRHPERWDDRTGRPVKPKSESTIFDNIEII